MLKCCGGQPNYVKDLLKISATGSGRAPEDTGGGGGNELREDGDRELREDGDLELRD